MLMLAVVAVVKFSPTYCNVCRILVLFSVWKLMPLDKKVFYNSEFLKSMNGFLE